MFVRKASKYPKREVKTFRVFAARQEGKTARAQFKPARKPAK